VRLAPVHAHAFLAPQPVVLRLCSALLSVPLEFGQGVEHALHYRLLAAAHGLVIRCLQLQGVVAPPLGIWLLWVASRSARASTSAGSLNTERGSRRT
jgi:hypothetical protein